MKRTAAAWLAMFAVVTAGCSAQPHPASSAPSSGAPSVAAPSSGAPSSGAAGRGSGQAGQSPASAVGVTSQTLPGCTEVTQQGPALPAADTALAGVPGAPFGVAATSGGWAFVAVGATIGVFRSHGTQAPSLVRQIPVPGSALGEALTPDGRYLLVADGESGADVLSVQAAESGKGRAVLGVLSAPTSAMDAGGAIEVAVSADGGYAFVSVEDDSIITVFDLQGALAAGFGPADYVGSIPTQVAPVGLAVSPDGRWLYSTSEAEEAQTNVGTLAVIDVVKAETDPAGSVVARTSAGCNPVRVITSADGNVVWVTARASDALLAFSASRLLTDPAHALLADVRVGELPVGLALVRGGTRIVVADSDRFDVSRATASLAVVDVPNALAGQPALLGYLPAGMFPRDMTLAPGGQTLLVSNYASSQLEAVDVADLP
jgi:DNA-binding beta-propeller fold protein YncE